MLNTLSYDICYVRYAQIRLKQRSRNTPARAHFVRTRYANAYNHITSKLPLRSHKIRQLDPDAATLKAES